MHEFLYRIQYHIEGLIHPVPGTTFFQSTASEQMIHLCIHEAILTLYPPGCFWMLWYLMQPTESTVMVFLFLYLVNCEVGSLVVCYVLQDSIPVDKAPWQSPDGGDLEGNKGELIFRTVIYFCKNKPLGLPEQKRLNVINLLPVVGWLVSSWNRHIRDSALVTARLALESESHSVGCMWRLHLCWWVLSSHKPITSVLGWLMTKAN